MGEVIRKDAAARNIVADAKTTITNATARGGKWQELADERLAPIVLLVDKIDIDANAINATLGKVEAEIAAFDGETDDFLGAKADEMWNLVGRPGFDPAYSLIWPGGASAYAEGSDEAQPDRMDLLADLLDAGIHPKLDPAWGKAAAAEVRQRAAAYRQKLAPALAAQTKARLLGKAFDILARATQMEMARLKRRYLSEGFTEADVHAVIPDRPRPKAAKPEDAPPTPKSAEEPPK